MATRILVVDDSPTIRRVVSMILERHGYESAQATDGQDALDALLAGEVKADLVLVDFVMPRMNGFQFCRALREHTELAMTPVVLMSAKGDRIRDQFVQQTGAIDAITKPFDAQALVAVVENALRRISIGKVSSARLPELDPEEEAEALELVQPSQRGQDLRPPSGEVETKRTQIAQVIATRLAEIASEVVTKRPGAKGRDLLGALVERLSGEALVEMTEVLRELARDGEHAPVLTGDLAAIPVGAVLQLLAVENQTGVLVCTHAGLEVSTTFRNGLIDLVQSTGASDEFRLGRYFVEEGILTPQEIDGLLQRDEPQPPSRVSIRIESKPPDTVRLDPGARPTLPSDNLADDASSPTIIADVSQLAAAYEASRPPSSDRTLAAPPLPSILSSEIPTLPRARPLGTMLREAGKVTQAQLDAALARQSSELLYDVLRWPQGRFELWKAPPSALADSARLGLPVASVVMEGFRRVDEWRVLERTIGSFDEVIVKDDGVLATLDAKALPARERTILDLADGERSVRKIVSDSHMSSFDACRILVQFLEARVLRRRAA